MARAEERRRRARQRRWRRVLSLGAIGAALAALVAVGVAVLTGGSERPQQAAGSSQVALAGQSVPLVGGNHVPGGTDVEYNSNPPACGDHWPDPAAWGIYPTPVPDEQVVHNLEHGGIWISYRLVDPGTLRNLEAIAAEFPQAVILTRRRENDSRIALASWCRVETLDSFDQGRIRAFISANVNKSPEPLVTFEQPVLEVGQPFPGFALAEVDGRQITRESLAGKPSIIWFTTTYCVPCQIGAREVARLDDELGGDAFDVLVLFVDRSETPDQLRSWRDQFARDDWMLSLDTALAEKIQIRFLDSKILLDGDGVIRNVDFNIADERYLDVIRGVVGAAR